MTLLAKWNRLPPFRVFLLGFLRHRLTVPKLVIATGLDRKTIHRLARAEDWSAFPAKTISAFCAACHVNLDVQQRHHEYLKRLQQSDGLERISKHPQRKYLTAVGVGERNWRRK